MTLLVFMRTVTGRIGDVLTCFGKVTGRIGDVLAFIATVLGLYCRN